jgi:4-hydroxythreonine-4-phosphate dehydrogenase
MMALPIALTCGEPASIAPEITAKAWRALHLNPECCFFLIGDADDVARRLFACNISVPLQKIENSKHALAIFKDALPILHYALPAGSHAGKIDSENSFAVIEAITLAVQFCFLNQASAIVTNPINKDALYAAGFKHQGHTDFLAHLARQHGDDVQEVMMLVGGGLRAVPITIHIPLKDVPQKLKTRDIIAQGEIVHHALQKQFGIKNPRIAVTGLNPHAGENGAMGSEDIDIVAPAVENLKKKGLNIFGPISADTAFHPEARATYDAILCMYHDQALIPVKTLDFHGGVNVTLGLPFIRTSPDHGTALGLAGTGTARPDSLIAAIKLAAQMAQAK